METWRAYRKSQTLFRTVSSPTPYGLPFPKIGDSQPHPKTAIAIILGTAKATNFKFGRYIDRVHPNKSPLKILDKRERGRIQGLPIFSVPHIISGTGKATNFQFCTHILSIDRNKSPLKNFGKPSKHKHAGPVWVVGGQHGLPRDGLWPGLTLGSTRVPSRLYPLIP